THGDPRGTDVGGGTLSRRGFTSKCRVLGDAEGESHHWCTGLCPWDAPRDPDLAPGAVMASEVHGTELSPSCPACAIRPSCGAFPVRQRRRPAGCRIGRGDSGGTS